MKKMIFILCLCVPQIALAQAQTVKAKPTKVEIVTSMGNIIVALDPKTPITTKNFLKYVDKGYYNGTIFHRVISNFMIQGGGMLPNLTKKPTQAPITLEVGKGLSNARATIAMARTSNPNSATSQFFINVANNKRLDTAGGGYAVFGKVIKGMDVVDKIRTVKTSHQKGHGDVPVKPVVIKTVKRLKS